MHIGVEA
jgi:hypothetical protein